MRSLSVASLSYALVFASIIIFTLPRLQNTNTISGEECPENILSSIVNVCGYAAPCRVMPVVKQV